MTKSVFLCFLSREFSRLQRQADHLRKEQARREGQKQGQEDQARHLKRELESDLYSGTEARHKDMLAKLKVMWPCASVSLFSMCIDWWRGVGGMRFLFVIINV